MRVIKRPVVPHNEAPYGVSALGISVLKVEWVAISKERNCLSSSAAFKSGVAEAILLRGIPNITSRRCETGEVIYGPIVKRCNRVLELCGQGFGAISFRKIVLFGGRNVE
jgi:hypothetical protein